MGSPYVSEASPFPATLGAMAMEKSVALLRAINVGKHNRIKMDDLRPVFESLGCRDVSTYIASGNVIFVAPAKVRKTLARKAEAMLEEEHGVRSPVILRQASELAATVERCPFTEHDPKKVHLVFLADEPTGRVDPATYAPDQLHLEGRELHLHTPLGLGRSKLDNQKLDRALGTVTTTRGLRTVRKLIELCG